MILEMSWRRPWPILPDESTVLNSQTAIYTMGPISNKELVAKYFTDVGDNIWKSHCGMKRVKGRGWQNLLDHVSRDHLDSIDKAKSSSQATVSYFFRKKDSDIFSWIKWIVKDILPFNFCAKENARIFTKLEPISVKTYGLHGKTDFLVEEQIEKALPNHFALAFDGWTEARFITWLFFLLFPTLRSSLDSIRYCYHSLL